MPVGLVRCAYLFVKPHQQDASKHKSSKEPRRNVSGIRVPMPFLLNIRDTPSTNGDLRANIYDREERANVYCRYAEDCLVLVRLYCVLLWAEVVELSFDF